MTLVAVTAPAGGNGVTTVAAALTRAWPGPCLLVECDPSGGDVGAWWDLPASPGLASAVAAAPGDIDAILGHTAVVDRSVVVLAAPTRSAEAAVTTGAAVQRLLPLLRASRAVEAVVDAGRSSHQLAAGVGQAVVTVVVSRQVPGSVRASAVVLERTADLLEVCARTSTLAVVALVGEDPFPVAEVRRFLAVPVYGIADDPLGAGVIAGRPSTGRLATRSRLLRSVRPLAVAVRDQLLIASLGVPS